MSPNGLTLLLLAGWLDGSDRATDRGGGDGCLTAGRREGECMCVSKTKKTKKKASYTDRQSQWDLKSNKCCVCLLFLQGFLHKVLPGAAKRMC